MSDHAGEFADMEKHGETNELIAQLHAENDRLRERLAEVEGERDRALGESCAQEHRAIRAESARDRVQCTVDILRYLLDEEQKNGRDDARVEKLRGALTDIITFHEGSNYPTPELRALMLRGRAALAECEA